MIKSTHPDFEALVAGKPVAATPALLEFLGETGLSSVRTGDMLRLDSSHELLDDTLILQALIRERGEPVDNLQLEVHRVVGSTNDIAMQRLAGGVSGPVFCTAEMQTAGRGRRGRQWISPFGRNIYLSFGDLVHRELSELGGLSLIVGMQAVDVLREAGLTEVGLKWPNDLLLEGAKLGGILVELKTGINRGVGIVAGIGINLALSTDEAAGIDQPWSSAAGRLTVSRNALVGKLCGRLLGALRRFDTEGFAPFREQWPAYNIYYDRQVTVIRGEDEFTGMDTGVDADGNLLLEGPGGLQVHNSGEVSMRPRGAA